MVVSTALPPDGVGLILAAYRSRVKGLQLQTASLEVQVAQRTHELQIAKNAAEESKNLAEKANQAKTIFLANMSHELRTPLNAILGFSNLLRESRRVSEKQRRDLDIVNRSGEHLLSLINDVLDMAKIDAGRIVIENAPRGLGGPGDRRHGSHASYGQRKRVSNYASSRPPGFVIRRG